MSSIGPTGLQGSRSRVKMTGPVRKRVKTIRDYLLAGLKESKHAVSVAAQDTAAVAAAAVTGLGAGTAVELATGNFPAAFAADIGTAAAVFSRLRYHGQNHDAHYVLTNNHNSDPAMTKYYKKKGYGSSTRKIVRNKKYGRMVMTRGVTLTPEVKHVDVASTMNVGLAGTYSTLGVGPYITQGTDFTNRIGRRIKLVKILWRCNVVVTVPGNMPLQGDSVVCALWVDHECKGATAAASDIYEPGATIVAFPNASNLRRFKQLGVKTTHKINPVAVSGVPAVTAAETGGYFEQTIPCNYLVNYITNAGTVADIIDNNIVLTSCGGTALGAAAYQMNLNFRFYYVDM